MKTYIRLLLLMTILSLFVYVIAKIVMYFTSIGYNIEAATLTFFGFIIITLTIAYSNEILNYYTKK